MIEVTKRMDEIFFRKHITMIIWKKRKSGRPVISYSWN